MNESMNANTCDFWNGYLRVPRSAFYYHFSTIILSSRVHLSAWWIIAKLLLKLLSDSSCQKKVSFQPIQYSLTSFKNQTEFSDLVDQREQQFMCSKCYFVASTNSELQMHEMSCN